MHRQRRRRKKERGMEKQRLTKGRINWRRVKTEWKTKKQRNTICEKKRRMKKNEKKKE